MAMNRFMISMPAEDIARFEAGREAAGMGEPMKLILLERLDKISEQLARLR